VTGYELDGRDLISGKGCRDSSLHHHVHNGFLSSQNRGYNGGSLMPVHLYPRSGDRKIRKQNERKRKTKEWNFAFPLVTGCHKEVQYRGGRTTKTAKTKTIPQQRTSKFGIRIISIKIMINNQYINRVGDAQRNKSARSRCHLFCIFNLWMVS
jgi:hypothetical protein